MNSSGAIEGCMVNLRRMATDETGVEFRTLVHFLQQENPVFDELIELANTDPSKPYGRQVLLETEALEVMVAAWTRGVPCAPHDHGGSAGAVRVLQGRAHHRIWSVRDGQLQLVREEHVEAGGVMACGPSLIHSMSDDGAEAPLVTLHMYTQSVDNMVVFDEGRNETLVVEGSCGAWVPHDKPNMIRSVFEGIVDPKTIR